MRTKVLIFTSLAVKMSGFTPAPRPNESQPRSEANVQVSDYARFKSETCEFMCAPFGYWHVAGVDEGKAFSAFFVKKALPGCCVVHTGNALYCRPDKHITS